MAEEVIQDVPEQKPSYLDEVKKEHEDMKKLRDEIKSNLEEIKRIRAEEILSGRAPQTKPQDSKDENPVEYLKRVSGVDLTKR